MNDRPLHPRLGLLVLCLGFPLAAHANPAGDGQITIYRCTDARGQLSLRDTPCLPGEEQKTVAMQRPQDPPPRPASAPPSAPSAIPVREAAPAPFARSMHAPPPPIYRCTTPDGEQYTSDSADGNFRWVPLWTLGYYPVPVGPGYGHHPGRYPAPPVRPAAHYPYVPAPSPQPRVDRSGFMFDSVGRPSPKPTRSQPGIPDRLPAAGIVQGPGTWIRDTCVHIPQAEVCDDLRDRRSSLTRRYNSALQSERRQIDSEKRTIDDRLANECHP